METDRKSIHSVIEASGPPQEFPDLAASTLLIHGKRYKKHERHWYEEGNFGFLVGDIAFRLHRSILSRRSSVISDLFSTPQPLFPIPELPSSGDNLIGVPFMELEDRAEDFAHILDFIYPNSLPVVQTRHLGVKNLMGIVRFTRKYLINDLKEWAISTLDSHLLPHASRGQSSPLKALLDKPSLYADPKFCIDIVHFSGECSLPKFLPLAFYALATAEWDQILGGASCLDQLSAQDRTRVHEGRLALSKAVLEKIPSLFEKLSSREGCTEDGCNSTKSLEPSTRWKGLMLHPLEELESLKVGWPFRTRFCVDCQKLVNQTQTIRDELKGRLTEFFKLEPKVAVANGSPGYDR